MKLSVTKIFHFEAAHHLPGYFGPCKNVHGHSYRLEVTATGTIDPTSGMLIDFTELGKLVKPLLERYDHCDLNNFFPMPTAENMLLSFWETLHRREPRISSLRLYETASSFAEISNESE